MQIDLGCRNGWNNILGADVSFGESFLSTIGENVLIILRNI
jgi:hypothetical protein